MTDDTGTIVEQYAHDPYGQNSHLNSHLPAGIMSLADNGLQKGRQGRCNTKEREKAGDIGDRRQDNRRRLRRVLPQFC